MRRLNPNRKDQRAYYHRNKASEAQRRKKWFADHPGYATAKTREFRQTNPGYWREWAETHRENLRAADRRYREQKRQRICGQS